SVTRPTSAAPSRLDAYRVGEAAWRWAAGRERKEDEVSFGAGVGLHVKPGGEVGVGEPLFTLHTDEPERFDRAEQDLEGAFPIGVAEAWEQRPLIIDRID